MPEYGPDVSAGQTYTESGFDEHIPSGGGASAFMYDDDLGTYWRLLNPVGAWATIQFSSAKTIAKYRLYILAEPYWSGWTLSGSNNGVDWDALDVVAGQGNPSGWADYYIDTPASYTYYKFSAFTITGAQNITMTEVEMMELIYKPKIMMII